MKRPLTFVDGLGAGLGVAAFAVLLWLVSQTSTYEHMYGEFGDAQLPPLTRLVLHHLWTYGAPSAVLALGAVALVTRARFATVAVALIALALVALTYQGLLGPLSQLAPTIQ